MQGAAGAGHQRRYAELGKHLRGRRHLGAAPHRVPAGAVGDPVHGGGVGRGELGRDVLPQPRLVARGPGGLQGLDDRAGHALVKHAAQEFLAGREPGRAVEHLDAGAERPEQGGVAGGSGSAGQHRDPQAAPGHRGHHRDVGERHACVSRQDCQLPLGAGRGGVQVGPQDIRPGLSSGEQAGQPSLERLHRGLRAVDAQHELGLLRRLGLAGGVQDGFGRWDRWVVAADPGPRGGQVAGDNGTGLTKAEYRDDQRPPFRGHHARGWSAATPTPSGGVAGPPGSGAPGPGSRRARGSVSGWPTEPAWSAGWAPAADPAGPDCRK